MNRSNKKKVVRNPRSQDGQDDLTSLLRDKPEDEKAGANATLGFTYQQWWATLKATDLYAAGGDFAIGVEVKEDVAILNSSKAPTAVEFCQVKKHEREGAWSWSELLRAIPRKGSGSDPSPLAKLYSRRQEFSGHPTKLTFVSNLAFKVPLEDTKSLQHSTGCGLDEFAATKVQEVKEKISSQLGIPMGAVDLTDFSLQRTYLPLGEQDVFVTGKLSTLSDTGKLPFKISKPHVSARMLAAEFQQRCSNTDYANTFAKLRARCLSKTQITQVLLDVESAGPSIQTALEEALARLDRESYHYGTLKEIHREKIGLCAYLCDRTNGQMANLCRLFWACREKFKNDFETMAKLGEMMDYLVRQSSKESPSLVAGVAKGHLNGLALLVINDAIKIDVYLAPSSPQLEEEQ